MSERVGWGGLLTLWGGGRRGQQLTWQQEKKIISLGRRGAGPCGEDRGRC